VGRKEERRDRFGECEGEDDARSTHSVHKL
jgi:hypothetical protein